jgi:hypothetical protein
VYNSISDIDEPGEYVVFTSVNTSDESVTEPSDQVGDESRLQLLVYPPAGSMFDNLGDYARGGGGGNDDGDDDGGNDDGPMLSTNSDAVVHAINTSSIHFKGIDIQYGRAWGAVFSNCINCR